MRSIKTFFALYFGAAPTQGALHDANMVKVLGYAAHVLLIVGALTSVPALLSSFMSLWLAIFGDGTFGFGASVFFSLTMTGLVIFLVDMKLAAISPYTFKKIGETIEQPQRSPRDYVILVLLAAVVCLLAHLSMKFSYDGNTALMETLFKATAADHKAGIALDSQKIATKALIERRYSHQITDAKTSDALALTAAKKEGRAMVKNAIAAAQEKYKGQYNLYKLYAPTIIGRGKEDSAAHVAKVVLKLPQIEMRLNGELHEVERTFIAAKMERDDKAKMDEQKRSKQINAVFMLTGGLGSWATLIGLGCLLLGVLISWKPKVVPTQPHIRVAGDASKMLTALRSKLDAELVRLNDRIESNGDPKTPAANVVKLWEEIELLDHNAAAAYSKQFAARFQYYSKADVDRFRN